MELNLVVGTSNSQSNSYLDPQCCARVSSAVLSEPLPPPVGPGAADGGPLLYADPARSHREALATWTNILRRVRKRTSLCCETRATYDQHFFSFRRIHEVTATCNRRRCYKGCRLMLLGGGRCTAGGCMCYHAYFDHEGTPISR